MKVLAFKDTHTSRKEIDISGRALTMSGLIPAHSKDSEFSSFYSKTSQRGSNMIYKTLATHQEYNKEKMLGLRQQF